MTQGDPDVLRKVESPVVVFIRESVSCLEAMGISKRKKRLHSSVDSSTEGGDHVLLCALLSGCTYGRCLLLRQLWERNPNDVRFRAPFNGPIQNYKSREPAYPTGHLPVHEVPSAFRGVPVPVVSRSLEMTQAVYDQLIWAYENGTKWEHPWRLFNEAHAHFGTELAPLVQYFLTGNREFARRTLAGQSRVAFQQLYWLCRALPAATLTHLAPHRVLLEFLQPAVFSPTLLAECVGMYLIDTIMAHPALPEPPRCNEAERSELQIEVIMWSFLQCLDVPIISLDTDVHTLSDWTKLSGPLVGAAVAQCPGQRTFVHVYMQDPNNDAHGCLFMVDIPGRRQTFFDPSGAALDFYPNMHDFFRTNQLWGAPSWTCEVVHNREVGEWKTLQSYFEPDDEESGGSCISVCLLMLVFCLRFNCWDMQRMCDTMRLALRKFEQENGQPDALRHRFVSMLYSWHRSFDPLPETEVAGAAIPRTDGWRTRGQLLRDVFHIRLGPHNNDRPGRICGVLLANGDPCSAPLCAGWAVCTQHLLEQFRVVCEGPGQVLEEPWCEPVSRVGVQMPDILAGGPGDCPSIGTVIYSVRPRDPTVVPPQPLIGVVENGAEQFTILRLVSFITGPADDLAVLGQHLRGIPWQSIRTQNPRMLVQMYHSDGLDYRDLSKMVQTNVPMNDWEALVVLAQQLDRPITKYCEVLDPKTNECYVGVTTETFYPMILALSVDTTRQSSVVPRVLEANVKYNSLSTFILHIVAEELPSDLVELFPPTEDHGALCLMMRFASQDIVNTVESLLENIYWGYMGWNGQLLQGVHVVFPLATHWIKLPSGSAYVSGEEALLRTYFRELGEPRRLPIIP